MAIKARFSQQQLPVKVVAKDDISYIYICQNETFGSEEYPTEDGKRTAEYYYEYDYNEIIGPSDKLPLDEIQAHPENYLDYAYVPEKEGAGGDDLAAQAMEEIQALKAAIERGLTV